MKSEVSDKLRTPPVMNDFSIYFDMGWQHIISWDALDHILFVVALSAIYLLGNWKQVLVLVTAFTIGHSLTLALSVYDIIRIKSDIVEFLIPCTIIVTGIFNLFQNKFDKKGLRFNYLIALGFGLIHGLGFANTIRFILGKGNTGWGLFGFNVGLEAGQIVVVTGILLLSYIIVNKAGLPRKWWVAALSLISIIMAFKMLYDRWAF